MNAILNKTADHYGKLFALTTEGDFDLYKQMISPKQIVEDDAFFRNKRILELGCGGIGHAIAGFIKYGAREVVGVDISDENLNRLKKRFDTSSKIQLKLADICNLPKNLGKFDIVYSDGVIHHTSNPKKVVADAHKLLKKGGVMIVGLYGKGGIIISLLHVLRKYRRFLPKKLFYSLFLKWPAVSFLLGDYIYAPILICYSEEEAKKLFMSAGFSWVVRIPNRSVVKGWNRFLRASQADYQSIISKLLFGTGWITLKAYK